MSKAELYEIVRYYTLGVVATRDEHGGPEAALVGIAVSETLELVFDTDKTSRKFHNLLHCPMVAAVIGWDNETSIQYEGEARLLSGKEDDLFREIYFQAYPDGRQRAADPRIVHFKIEPRWIRYSNYNAPVLIEEFRW
jgi:pyridoxine/pyridoxamine 5'-phosphate oxidase